MMEAEAKVLAERPEPSAVENVTSETRSKLLEKFAKRYGFRLTCVVGTL